MLASRTNCHSVSRKGTGLGRCIAEPTPKNFTLVDQRPAKAEEAGNTLQAAETACKDETRTKGIKSVVNIFARLRQGSADEDYVACMKRRGYEVKQ